MTFEEFIECYEFRIKVKKDTSYDNSDGKWDVNASHYKITLKSPYFKGKFKSEYHCGPASKPNIRDFLYCIQSDCYASHYTYEEFCGEFEEESVDGYKCWQKCVEVYRKMTQYLGLIMEEFEDLTEE